MFCDSDKDGSPPRPERWLRGTERDVTDCTDNDPPERDKLLRGAANRTLCVGISDPSLTLAWCD